MQRNTTKAKLQAGESVFGCFLRYRDANLAELLGYVGWDFLVIDSEHGTIEPRDCEDLVRAAELRGVTPVVRVPTNHPALILRYMDTGAQGVQLPMIASQNEAEAAVQAVKYQPRGRRGLAGTRAADYGQVQPLKAYVAEANAETLVVAQIETAEAVAQLPEIVQVEDLDVLFVGPTDLSHSLGRPGEVDHPEVHDVIDHIAETVLAAGKVLGIMAYNAEAARRWRARGARYITMSLEALLAPACRTYLAAVRT